MQVPPIFVNGSIILIGVSHEGDCGEYERLGITILQFSRGSPLLFDPEDRAFTFLRNLGGIFRTTGHYNPESRILLRMFSAIQTLITWLKRVVNSWIYLIYL